MALNVFLILVAYVLGSIPSAVWIGKRFYGIDVREHGSRNAGVRFIPILVEETDKIMKAQMARGADFESGNLVQKAKAMIPLLVPLFISAFRRATDLAMAMEARCYRGGEGRTKMKPLQYSQKDHEAYMVFALYFVLIIASRVYL